MRDLHETCLEIESHLPLWAGGDLEPEVQESVESHLAVCERCTRAAVRAREARAALRRGLRQDAERMGAGRDPWPALRAVLREEGLVGAPSAGSHAGHPGPRLRRLSPAWAAAAAVLVGLFLYGTWTPEGDPKTVVQGEVRPTEAKDAVAPPAPVAEPAFAVLPAGLKRKALERFHEARRQLFIKVGELREAEDWKRWANVPKQDELIAAVEALAANPEAGPLPARLKELQEAWKAVGPAPKEKAQDLWQRFKTASDKVYERIVQHRHDMAGEHKENLKRKQDLCVRAEELAESTDWGPAAEALKRLQAEWKKVGQVPRKQADEVWKRFRAACDRFFERRRPHLEKTLGERQANLEAKQALVEKAEALAQGDDEADWEGAIRQVGFLRREWREVGPVPQREFEVLGRRFFDACDHVYARRDEAKQNLLARRLGEVTEPFAAAEALVASAGEGQEIDGAQLAENVIKARAALREFESSGASLGDEVRERMATLCRRAVEVAPTAFKGSDLDPEQSRKRKEKLLARVEELARRAAAAPAAPTTPQEMAARLKAALADRALGGVLAKETRPAGEQVAEAREAWRKLGPVPGDSGEQLERRFDDACRQATGSR